MVAQIFEYSMIKHQIIHSFESLGCILVIEFIIDVTLIEVIDFWKLLPNVLYEYEAQRKSC